MEKTIDFLNQYRIYPAGGNILTCTTALLVTAKFRTNSEISLFSVFLSLRYRAAPASRFFHLPFLLDSF
jgi:hypothetical protein